MKKSWWKTLLTKLRPEVSQEDPGFIPKPRTFHVRLYSETNDNVVVFLDEQVIDVVGLQSAVVTLTKELEMSKKNVSINSRRRDRLRADHPDIYQRYFTKKGLKNEL